MSSGMQRTFYTAHMIEVYSRVDKRVNRGLSALIKRRVWNRNFSDDARWLVNLRVIENGMDL